jgi:hypothetical protein
VTTNPTEEWISRQITEAFPWDSAPRYLIRDRDTAYGLVFVQRLRAMGIRDKPIAPRSPWQNPYVERLIGTMRKILCGERREFMASCSSSASRSLSPASRSTWSSVVDRRPRDGAPSCVTTHRTSPQWTCSSPRPLASLLYVLVILRLARRDLVWINVTSKPTAEWIARQITEAFPWNEAPR